MGIDIVCKAVDGEFWAVQCKFYAETSIIDKAAVDTFLATSSKLLTPDAKKFWQLSRAGRQLAEIHLNYETQEPPAQVEVIGTEKNNFAVKKLRFASKDDRTILIYNDFITIKNIPPRCFEYVVNGRSPLEWIIDRYQIKTDSAS